MAFPLSLVERRKLSLFSFLFSDRMPWPHIKLMTRRCGMGDVDILQTRMRSVDGLGTAKCVVVRLSDLNSKPLRRKRFNNINFKPFQTIILLLESQCFVNPFLWQVTNPAFTDRR